MKPKSESNNIWPIRKIIISVIIFFILLLIIPFQYDGCGVISFFLLNVIFFMVNKNLVLGLNTACSMFLILPTLYNILFDPRGLAQGVPFYYPGLMTYTMSMLAVMFVSFYILLKKHYKLSFLVVVFGYILKFILDFVIKIYIRN